MATGLREGSIAGYYYSDFGEEALSSPLEEADNKWVFGGYGTE